MKTSLIVILGAIALAGCATQPSSSYVAERQSPAETEAMIRESNRFPQSSRPDTFAQSYDPGMRNSNLGSGYRTYSPGEFSHGHWGWSGGSYGAGWGIGYNSRGGYRW